MRWRRKSRNAACIKLIVTVKPLPPGPVSRYIKDIIDCDREEKHRLMKAWRPPLPLLEADISRSQSTSFKLGRLLQRALSRSRESLPPVMSPIALIPLFHLKENCLKYLSAAFTRRRIRPTCDGRIKFHVQRTFLR
jgi:hypothetical protein